MYTIEQGMANIMADPTFVCLDLDPSYYCCLQIL